MQVRIIDGHSGERQHWASSAASGLSSSRTKPARPIVDPVVWQGRVLEEKIRIGRVCKRAGSKGGFWSAGSAMERRTIQPVKVVRPEGRVSD